MGQWVAPVIDEIDPELRENIGVLPMPLKGVDEDNICYGIASYLLSTRIQMMQKSCCKRFCKLAAYV